MKVRDSVMRVNNSRRNVDDLYAVPIQAHGHLDIEIHSCAEPAAAVQGDYRLKRIDAKAAHRIVNLPRHRIDRNPEICQTSGVKPQRRRASVVFGTPKNQRIGMRRRRLYEERDVGGPVLAIGINLNRMAVPSLISVPQSGQDRAAFAAIYVMAEQRELP